MKVASSLYVTMYWILFFRKHRCNRRSEGVEYRATVMGGGQTAAIFCRKSAISSSKERGRGRVQDSQGSRVGVSLGVV